MTHPIQAYTLTSIAGLLALGIGAATLVQTDFVPKGKTILGGHYQRAVETRFDNAIPLRNISSQAFAAINLGLFGQTLEGAIVGASRRMFTTEELVMPVSNYDFVTELEAANDQLSALGIKLVPVIVPDKARIYADDLSHDRSKDLIARFVNIQAMIASMGLETIDLLDAFTAPETDRDVFMQTDTHWSPQGAEIAARIVANQIAKYELEQQEFVTTIGAAEPFQGDLIRFADTGMFRPWVGPITETITPLETTAVSPADDLFGDVEIPLALVGTSFSARTEFHFEGYLKQETGLDLINYATSGEGPFAPMQFFLNSDVLHTNPPKIVIWEIPERYISSKDMK